MKTFFPSPHLWESVEDGYEEPSVAALTPYSQSKQKEYEEHKKSDTKALFYIQQGVRKSIFPRIMASIKSKDAWGVLKNGFQVSEKVISINFNLCGENLIIFLL